MSAACPMTAIGFMHTLTLTHTVTHALRTGPFSKPQHQQIAIELDQLLSVQLRESANRKSFEVTRANSELF